MTLDASAGEETADATGRSTFGQRDGREWTGSGVSEPEPDEIEQVDETPGRRRSRAARRPSIIFLNFLMTVAVFGVLGAVVAAGLFMAEFRGPGPLAADGSVVVREGATLTSVARELESRGMIENARLFTLGARVVGNDRAIKTGEFAIPASASMESILNELTNGSPVEYRVTIPEGLTVWQAAQRIAEHPELVGDMPATLPAEGWLGAETINFARGESRAVVIEKLRRIQEQRVASVWERRSPDSPVSSPEELLTLASIIEKETAIAEERGLVAGVFANRVRENWHLNTDPTLIYGVFGGKGLPDGRPILQSDKEDRNPYNTYIFRGLPPGPIAIPGLASLEAAANPAKTDAMFFVADGTGGHAFSATMEEHNRYVAALRQRERERGTTAAASAPQGDAAAQTEPGANRPATAAMIGGPADSDEQAAPAADTQVASTDAPVPDADAPVAAPAPPGFVKDGVPAPGIPVPLMRPR